MLGKTGSKRKVNWDVPAIPVLSVLYEYLTCTPSENGGRHVRSSSSLIGMG